MSTARSLLILLLISTSVSAADLCKAKKVVKKVAPGDDGVAAFELKLNERVVIEAFKATVCVAAFLPDRDSKSGRTGPSVDYVVHTAKGESACRGVRRILRERGLEAQLKIAVGGAPYRFNPELYQQVGADGWAENGVLAVELMERLVHEVTG